MGSLESENFNKGFELVPSSSPEEALEKSPDEVDIVVESAESFTEKIFTPDELKMNIYSLVAKAGGEYGEMIKDRTEDNERRNESDEDGLYRMELEYPSKAGGIISFDYSRRRDGNIEQPVHVIHVMELDSDGIPESYVPDQYNLNTQGGWDLIE